MGDLAISSRDLVLGYDKIPVVSECSFELPLGASLALVGINGSGKSTLLKTLAGLIPKIRGNLTVLGKAPGKSPKSLAYHAQFHPTAQVLPLRALDVVRMGRFSLRGLWQPFGKSDELAVQGALEAMGAREFAMEPINTLSGGQRQRVFLAHALAKEGDLYLFDEPTAGLDVPGMALFDQVIDSLKRSGRGIITATHNLKEASRCDFVLLLAQKVVAFGTPSQVLNRENLLETFGLVAQSAGDGILVMEKEHGHDH